MLASHLLKTARKLQNVLENHTFLWSLTEPELFDSFGAYTLSEIAERLTVAGIDILQPAWNILSNENSIKNVVAMITLLFNEWKVKLGSIKDWDVAFYSKNVHNKRKDFFLRFLKWYGQKKYFGDTVHSFYFVNATNGISIIWTSLPFTMPVNQVQKSWIDAARRRTENASILANCSVTMAQCSSEIWYYCNGRVLSEQQVGV